MQIKVRIQFDQLEDLMISAEARDEFTNDLTERIKFACESWDQVPKLTGLSLEVEGYAYQLSDDMKKLAQALLDAIDMEDKRPNEDVEPPDDDTIAKN